MIIRHFSNPGAARFSHLALLSFGLLLALAGGVSPWLSFPLSLPWAGFNLQFGHVARSVQSVTLFSAGSLYLIAVFAAALAFLRGWLRACGIALVVAYAILLYAPVLVLFVDPQYVLTYIQDSAQRAGIQRFLNAYFWSNKDVEPTLKYISEFEHLDDRLVIASHIISWGWMVAFIGILLLALVVCRLQTSRDMRKLLLTGLGFVPVLHVLLFGTQSIYADYLHRQADRRLSEGRYSGALQDYAESLKRDLVLRHSEPFLLNVSKSFYQMNGNEDLYAQPYIADRAIKQRLYEAADVRLQLLNTAPMQATPFHKAILIFGLKQRADSNIARGLVLYKKLDFAGAGFAFERALTVQPARIDARFYLARVKFDMRQFPECARIIEGFISDIGADAIKADFYSTLGDAYLANGDPRAAREAYFRSLDIDNRDNYRAVKALSGT